MRKRTERQKEASRANGAKSNGPTTILGKEIACRNAIKHGFTSRMVLLDGEDPEKLQQMTYMFMDRFQPIDDSEVFLVMDIAAAAWRVRRLLSAETAMLDLEIHRTSAEVDRDFSGLTFPHHVAAAITSLGKTNSLQLLLRYIGRARRDYARSERELRELQVARGKRQNEPETQLNLQMPIPSGLPDWEDDDKPYSPPPPLAPNVRPPGEPKAAA
ncbi:MAG: hypothetical protein HYZ37_07475 [Candidatus Solibacter usitatus]|nr:hypothetical protein [Candidatus Solibacter usitatus]